MSALGATTKINSGKHHARERLQGGARWSGHAGPDQGYSSEGADTRHRIRKQAETSITAQDCVYRTHETKTILFYLNFTIRVKLN